METPASPLSSYVHFILLCRLPPTSAERDVCVALLMRALTNLRVRPTSSTTLATPRKRPFSILGNYVASLLLCLLSGTALRFFLLFDVKYWDITPMIQAVAINAQAGSGHAKTLNNQWACHFHAPDFESSPKAPITSLSCFKASPASRPACYPGWY